MKIKVPRQIDIGGHIYKIYFDPYLRSDSNNLGAVNHRTECITIEPANPNSVKSETLIHEVIHIGAFLYRIDASDDDIDRIAETIWMFLIALGIELDWSEIPMIKVSDK